MHKIFLTFILLFCTVFAIPSTATAVDYLQDFELTAENEYLLLFVNRENTEVAVQVKDTGEVWYTNPPDRDATETIARGRGRERLDSQFQITYFTPRDRERTMNNMTDSIAYGQFDIEPIDNGVRIDYTLGEEWAEDARVPIIIGSERFEEEILNKLDGGDRSYLEGQYHKVYLDEADPETERERVFQVDKEELFGEYMLHSPDMRRSSAIELFIDQLVEYRSDIDRRDQVQREDILTLVDRPAYVLRDDLFAWDWEDIAEILEAIEYGPQDAAVDHVQYRIDPPQPNQRVFHVPVNYYLDGKDFIAEVPVSEVRYPQDVIDERGQSVSYPLHAINLLEFFGAAGPEEEGYIFVPDGSGALIDLNNDKTHESGYRQPVYGRDDARREREEISSFIEQVYMPVFGIKQGDKAFLAVIEDGEAFSWIQADIAGRRNSYNTAFAEFTMLPLGVAALEADMHGLGPEQDWRTQINVYQSRPYQGNFRVRYSFLSGEEADYVGMAHRYREYLVRTRGLERVVPQKELPLLFEAVGAIAVQRPVMGVPREVVKSLTTYKDLQEMVSTLHGGGIEEMYIRYSGWLAGGAHHFFPHSLRREGVLGTEQEFHELSSFLREQGFGFHPDVDFVKVYHNRLLDRFSPRRYAARYPNRRIVQVADYDLATLQQRDQTFHLLSPYHLDTVIEGFMEGVENYGMESLSLASIGFSVHSDFRERTERLVDRQQTVEVFSTVLGDLAGSRGLKLIVDGGNSYVLPHSEVVFNLPFQSSSFNIIDHDVPFYQIAGRGYVRYAGEPVNLTADLDKELLKILETGALPYFKTIYRDPTILKGSEFDALYSAHFQEWEEDIREFYHRANTVLGDLEGQAISDHRRLAEDVYRTTYEEGLSVIVNYTRDPIEIDGLVIEGRDYGIVRGDIQ